MTLLTKNWTRNWAENWERMEEYIQYLSFGNKGWGDELLYGLSITVRLFVATLPLGLVLGFLIALAKRSDKKWLSISANIYTTIFRGVPELLTLFIIFYGGQILLQTIVELFVDDVRVDLSAFLAGMIALGFVFSAYASETFLSALNAVPPGQAEAARAMGMSWFRTMQKVVFPQVMRHALPGLSNLTLILQKETALVSILALDEVLRQTQLAVGNTKEPIFFFATACGLFILLAFLTSILFKRIEIWADRGQQRA